MKRIWQIATILSVIFALVANYLTATQALDIPAIKEVSDKYASPLTPATYAFSIWSVIYLLLVVFAVYQARDLFRPNKKDGEENKLPLQAGPLFVTASICNGLWTYVFLNDLVGLSLLILLTLAGCLYALLRRLRIAIDDAPIPVIVCVWWPLLLYTGWVTVASLANLGNWLTSTQIELPAPVAALALIALGAALLTLLIRRNVRELLLSSAWGIIAIGVRQLQSHANSLVTYTALAVGFGLIVACIVHGYVNRVGNPFWLFIKSKLRQAG